MGSGEHYCLRWNNHQSNLLGVFSQLLRDESLVDVTLACSEGHSIRAHRVVLSACSSYFQTLFLDHPSRHPIVILKDVRFAELRTLIEFMYKGEVNVEYCQLSALLKTAESLKVKGLAEMTTTITPPVATVSSNVTSQPEPSGGGEPDLHQHQQQQQAEQREREREREREQQREREQREREQYVTEQALRDNRSYEHNRLIQGNERIREREHLHRIDYHRSERKRHHHRTLEQQEQQILKSRVNVITPNSLEQLSHRLSDECVSSSPPQCDSPLALNTRGSVPPLDDKGGGTGGSEGGSGGTRKSESPDSIRDECIDGGADSCEPNDLSVNNNSSSVDPGGGRGSVPTAAACPTTSRLPSPHAATESEPVAGPSGLPPVQQVPLSLKKEVDWGGGSLEDSKTSADSLLEYRHPYEPLADEPGQSADGPPQRSPTPFPLLWSMFGAPLDDASCRLLGLLNARLGSPNAAAVTAAAATGGLGLPTVSTPPYRCLVCFAAFPSPWLLRQHTALQHASIVLPQPGNTADASGEEKPFVCEQCGQSYRYRSAYLKHREQNHRARLPADKLFACDVCGMQFRYLKSFKKHRLNHALERLHGRGSSSGPAGSASGGYGSDVESRPVPQLLSSVRAPAATDTGTDEVSSTNETVGASNSNEDNELCPKIKQEQPDQSSVNEYQTEEETTNKEMKKSPEECDQDNTIDSVSVTASTGAGSVVGDVSNSFQQQIVAHEASLLNLLQSDVGADRQRDRERRFACPFCGKCVRSKENLKLHVRKHTGERPFVCLFCGRAFGGKSDLTRHLRIHTGERPYHCDMCGKCFARADYLSKHLTTHMHTPR